MKQGAECQGRHFTSASDVGVKCNKFTIIWDSFGLLESDSMPAMKIHKDGTEVNLY